MQLGQIIVAPILPLPAGLPLVLLVKHCFTCFRAIGTLWLRYGKSLRNLPSTYINYDGYHSRVIFEMGSPTLKQNVSS